MGACRSNGETVMDAKNTIIKPWPKQGLSEHVRAAPMPVEPRPSREQAEAAVRTLIAYAGDNPDREGLLETPRRVIGAYEELYQGYRDRRDPQTARRRGDDRGGTYVHVTARGGEARRADGDDVFHRRIPRGCQ